MTNLHYLLMYLGLTYGIGIVWFLIFSRQDGFLFWRLCSLAVAPLAVPVLFVISVVIKVAEKIFSFQPKQ